MESEEIIEDIYERIKMIKNSNKLLDILDYADGKLEEDKYVGYKK